MAIFNFENVKDWHNANSVNLGDKCLIGDSIEELEDQISGEISAEIYTVSSINDYSFEVFNNEESKARVPFLYIMKNKPAYISGKYFLSKFLENRILISKDKFYNDPMLVTEVNSGNAEALISFSDGSTISSKTIEELSNEGYEWYTKDSGWNNFSSTDKE